jgi:CRISPR-associated RAMP protein (TIGR02581 family)
VFKQLLNEAILDLAIRPVGPILIKAGETGGLDPTHPDMEFVRTIGQVFIPGSSLKGVVRAHAERIVRSLQPGAAARDGRGACDPLKRGESCGDRLERQRLESHAKYAQSCAVCRLFGSTVVAGRVRFADALPTTEVLPEDRLTIEERNGVAIDRVYGSVAVGPFNYEVVTRGVFTTRIIFRNITLPQLALVGLALRDLGEGRVGLGFGKSRGLGRVALKWGRLELRYPLATLKARATPQDELLGVGELFQPEPGADYGFPPGDRAALPGGLRFEDDGWGTLVAGAEGQQIDEVLRVATARWREEVRRG